MCPRNWPILMPNTHSFGFNFILMCRKVLKISLISSVRLHSLLLLITISYNVYSNVSVRVGLKGFLDIAGLFRGSGYLSFEQALFRLVKSMHMRQELLTNIGKTCPSVNNTDEKLVAVTPKNKDKRVRFTEPVTTSGNTITKTTSPSNLVSNKPMLSSIGVKSSASASRSQYSDYHIGNVTILRVYYVEGLGHNLFSVGQFCDSNLEVAFRQHTCFIRNLEGVDLLTESRGNNLYTLSLGDMMTTLGSNNPSKTASLVRGLPKLKFEKDHLCSACAMGKLQPKADIDFDELTVIASEHSSSGPVLHEMTPATISSRLVPNLASSFNNPAEVVAPIHEVVALVSAESTGSPLLGFRASTLSTASNS
ncbi:hypothetical protein Tco_1212337 [Tanacetum coccineum]